MPRIARWVIVSGFMLAPFTAAAMSSTLWDFRGMAPSGWSVTEGMLTDLKAEGLHVRATKEGAIYRSTSFTHRIDTLRLTIAAATGMESKLVWKEKGADVNAMVELPIILDGGLQTKEIDLSKYPQWNPDTDAFGLSFPRGAEVVIQTMEFRGWNLIERMEEALFAMWTFDTFRAYSINFLWGPLIVTNPVARAQLFDFLPPFAASVNNYVYGIVALAGLAFLMTKFRRLDAPTQKKYWALFLGVGAACWVLYDARMSAEILTYAKTDMRTHVFASPGTQTFRQFEDFWSVLKGADAELREASDVVFAGPAGAPFPSFTRYALYPTNVSSVDAPHPKTALWLIYMRPDAALNPDGRLTLGGTTVSEPGAIIKRINENAFLFRETP